MAGSTTYGTTCSPLASSKISSFFPLPAVWALRSKSVRSAIPSSSDQPIGNSYSMSVVCFE